MNHRNTGLKNGQEENSGLQKISPIAIILVFLTIGNSSFGQENDCLKNVRDGRFKYVDKLLDVEIVRKKRKHIEYSNGGKSYLKMKIEWPNDSTYVLTLKKAYDWPGCMEKGDQITVNIIECKGNGYFAKYTSDECGIGEGNFIKIE